GGGGHGWEGMPGLYYNGCSEESAGAGGPGYGSIYMDMFEGGSGGGGGASGNDKGYWPGEIDSNSGGAGGAGGGAVYIEAHDRIIITDTGEISADGGSGGKGVYGNSAYGGGGAGGSGGSVWLKASEIEFDDIAGDGIGIHASGGVGGNGGYNWQHKGGDGSDGRIRMDAPNLYLNDSEIRENIIAKMTVPHAGYFGLADYDDDGLNNEDEREKDTDMYSGDTDDDGISDGVESDNGLDPLFPDDANENYDPDEWTNIEEIRQGTRPLEDDRGVDADSDGLNT
ncbi:MAG: hypothetical protein GY820_09880, partial [Gammaproteobacteria bacterium]|nr:hypothetical protein [Gammaproteobacteria bacterium]